MEYWIWLSLLPNIGPVTAICLLQHFGEPLQVYFAEPEELYCIKGITPKQIKSILANKSLEQSYQIIENCAKHNISILLQNDNRYPQRARTMKDAPIVLYYQGNLKEMNDTVAIVGARRCTQNAKVQAVQLAEQYARQNRVIISGMAKGIDSYAHTACLNAGGYTVAIVGNGLDICYPSEHKRLMEGIVRQGLLVSEYPPGTKPNKYTFPRRNRLISAWSDEIIVIAPGKGSGALITADYGRKYSRRVEIIE